MPYGLLPPYPVTPEEAWMVRALRPELLGALQGKVVCADAMSDPKYWRE
jgi:predicted N-acetyltransferase YhbS